MSEPLNLQVNNSKILLSHYNQLNYSPSAVYRLQLNKEFTLNQAAEILPYLKQFGIAAVYLSPVFQAVAGSLHGYDVTNPNVINPEIGGQTSMDYFCHTAKHLDMGIILDVVPNHMGIASNDNHFWSDVLENGPYSR